MRVDRKLQRAQSAHSVPSARKLQLTPRAQTVAVAQAVENVGRCDHSYLTHIARRYDTLPALTLFLKDTTFAHVHVGYASKLLTFLRRLPAPVDFWGARPLGRAKPDWEMKKYGSDLCRNDFIKKKRHGRTCYKSDSNYIRAGMLLGAWRSQMGLPNGSTYKFVPGGIFAASREAIRRTPLPVYERLQKEVSRGANLENFAGDSQPSECQIATRMPFGRVVILILTF